MDPPGPIVMTNLRHPEMPPLLLRRPRLSSALEAETVRSATVVVAPAGFGKTVAVADWVRRTTGPHSAWLTLDSSHDDPLRFWRHVFAAIGEVLPGSLPESRKSIHAGQIPAGELLTAILVNELCEIAADLRIVLDNFEVIENPSVLGTFVDVVEAAPPNVHFVMCSRVEPQLPVSGWRASGRMSELTVDDLRFTTEEAETYLDPFVAGDLTSDQIDMLVRKADGWIAGLYLAAVGVERARDVERFLATLGHAEGPIADYLVADVLAGLTVEMREFLLRTSFLTTLTAEASDATMDRTDSARMLRALHRHGLFVMREISTDDGWHYHPLFMELLQSLARAEFGTEGVAAIHRKAAAWYRRAADFAAAIGHAITSGEFDLVRDVAEDGWTELLHHDPRQLGVLLSSIPDDVMGGWLEGRQIELTAGAVRADAVRLLRLLGRERALPGSPLAPAIEAALSFVQGDVDRIAAMVDDPPRFVSSSLVAVGRALVADSEDRFEDGADALRAALHESGGSVLDNVLLMSLLAWNRARAGALGEAVAYAERTIEIADATGTRWSPAVQLAQLARGHVAFDRGDLDDAYRDVMPVVASTSVDARVYVEARILASHLHWSLGQRAAAAEYLAHATVCPTGPATGISAERVTLTRAMHSIQEGDIDLAESWLADCQTRLECGPETELERIALSRLLITRGEVSAAQALLEAASSGGRSPSVRYVIEARKTAALAAAAAQDPSAALLLGVAISMAETEGFVQTFVDDAAVLSSVRRSAAVGVRATVGPVHTALVEARFSDIMGSGAGSKNGLVEELTEREMSVLHYLPTRMTTVEIARELFISSNTVKTHLKAIYRKLGVCKRNEAVTAAVRQRLV